jgi:hypothetical protein
MQKKTIIALGLTIIIVIAAVSIIAYQQFATPTPDIPSQFTATQISTTRIDLTWVKAKNADTTYIERNNITTWSRGQGTEIYNDTGEHYQDIIPQQTQFYYQAWSWNQTDHTYSSTTATTNTTQPTNQPPQFGTQNPTNGTIDTPLSFTWSILINDPETDPFTWSIQCSNKQVNSGSSAANGIKTLTLTGLTNATTYTVYVNATDPSGSGQYTRRWYLFTTTSHQTPQNKPPVFSTPSPANGSTGNSLAFIWNISISDPDGDTFSWTIQCSNKQISSGPSATNGTKTLSLTGLASATTYKIWVNATDFSLNRSTTRRWYTFMTKTTGTSNQPPIYGTPSPTNQSTNNPLNLTWSIPIKDPEGNLFNWKIESHGLSSSGTSQTNGTKTLLMTGLSYNTTYTVYVNATDPAGSGQYTRRWYRFTTQTTSNLNHPPTFGTPSPANNSINNPLTFTWKIPINDTEGDTFNWSIHCSNGQTNSSTNATNGTKTLTLTGLTYETDYTVWVNATDPLGSSQMKRSWYIFRTKTSVPPTLGDTIPDNNSINNSLNVNWRIVINDPDGDPISWTIQCNNGQTNSSTNATNGTKNIILTGLSANITYTVYVNATDPSGSGLFTRGWYRFTTRTNQPPNFGNPTPPNHAQDTPLNLTWSILIYDSEGDLFNWSIQCSNGQTTKGTNDTNGTKNLNITHLVYGMTYKVWVNATDPTGSGRYTRKSYIFDTHENQPPQDPTITGPSEARIRVNVQYNFTTTDLENETVSYFIDWGDNTSSGWIGPYQSGETISQNHTWTKKTIYTIKAKAKDVNGIESDWTEFPVTMPFSYTHPLQIFLQKILERFPHAFPLLRIILGY